MTIYEQVIQDHQKLQERLVDQPGEVKLDEVKTQIKNLRESGKSTTDLTQREYLRSVLRHWGAYIFEQTAEYPAIQLAPPDGSLKWGTHVIEINKETISGSHDSRELTHHWEKIVEQNLEKSASSYQEVLQAFKVPFRLTYASYVVMLAIGIAAFVSAFFAAFFMGNFFLASLFAGVSLILNLAYFVKKPTQTLEEYLTLLARLSIHFNSYWARVITIVNVKDVRQAQQQIKEASDDFETNVAYFDKQRLKDAIKTLAANNPDTETEKSDPSTDADVVHTNRPK